ncbi:GspH/FimT family pseudopilin [Aquabacterium sp.]|uniref:GspH/FimT family pseudopilin n=1 Tax=Aquabacterium sp. TaxID=1872578 RepID=UPI002CDB5C2B|nr:GspH/FimT family pseudopilin [Aquabacterium sp.]HSW04644.1 GspH/FimT family pseudopilin [Aquabacterium sp.]
MNKKHLRTRGLTLLELMIGLAIVAILSSLAAPSFGAWLARNRVKAAANHLVADLGEARHEATRRGAALRVNFEPGKQWCYGITLDPAASCSTTGNAAVLKRVSASEHPGVVISTAEAMDFDGSSGTGLKPLARVRLVSSQGDVLQVKMTRLGRASVCAPEGGFPDLPPC